MAELSPIQNSVREVLRRVLKHQQFTVKSPDGGQKNDAVVQVDFPGSPPFAGMFLTWYISPALATRLTLNDDECRKCITEAQQAAVACFLFS